MENTNFSKIKLKKIMEKKLINENSYLYKVNYI